MSETPPPRLSSDLIDRYFTGQCTPDEIAHVCAALARNAELVALDHEVRGPSVDVDANWARFAASSWFGAERPQGRDDVQHVPSRSPSTGSRRTWTRIIPAAVGVCLLLLVGVGTWTTFKPGDDTPSVQRFTTVPGQRMTVRLADGSTMLLAPATSVAMTDRFVDVRGEAYFTVASQQTHPFVVRTSNALVRVLGTRFAVRQYPGSSASRIIVDDGRVAVQRYQANGADDSRAHTSARNDHSSTIVSARMLAVVADSGITVTSGIATRNYTGWTQGTLVFESVALRDVVTELSRAYGVDIRVADTLLAKQSMFMEVSLTEDALGQVLHRICKASNAHVTRGGSAYVLVPGRSAHDASYDVPPGAPRNNTILQPEQQYGK